MDFIIRNISKFLRNILVIILSFFMCVNVLYVDAFALDDEDNDSLDN